VSVAGEDLDGVQRQGLAGEALDLVEVADHGLLSSIVSAERVLATHVPQHVIGQQIL
jgi:hypothetical protein